jgi:hypothetical protein
MRTFAFSSLLLLSAVTAFGQNSSDLFDKTPPAIDEALRARVSKFYDAFVAGKFKDAYPLVADEAQDAFFGVSKDQFKSFEIIKIQYSDDFTKAKVVIAVKSDWRWMGAVTLRTFPVNSNWKVVDGQWYWYFEQPTMAPSPFSPTGLVPIPSGAPAAAPPVPKDIAGAAKGILSQVIVDKTFVRLRSFEASQDVVHVRNGMPGEVRLKLDDPNLPGLKVTPEKTRLMAHEEGAVVFEWRLDDPAIQCLDCAKKMSGRHVVQLHIEPTGQTFPISVTFENSFQQPTPPQAAAPPVK